MFWGYEQKIFIAITQVWFHFLSPFSCNDIVDLAGMPSQGARIHIYEMRRVRGGDILLSSLSESRLESLSQTGVPYYCE